MNLSDKIEQERQELLARRADERAAADARLSSEAAMTAALRDRLTSLLEGQSRDTVRIQPRAAHSLRVEVADFRAQVPRRRSHHAPYPSVHLNVSSNANGRTWALGIESNGVPSDIIDKDEGPPRLRSHKLSTSSLDEAVQWLEIRIARAIAYIQLWQLDHPVKSPAGKTFESDVTEEGEPASDEISEGAVAVGLSDLAYATGVAWSLLWRIFAWLLWVFLFVGLAALFIG